MSLVFNNQEPDFYISGILNGDVTVLSRAITFVESQNETQRVLARKIIDGVLERQVSSFRIGITGVPGVGKSTFIESFGKEVVSHGHKLAVLAIDPSSSKSKGSILGDKTRMESLSTDKNVFIRPSPSSGTLGGVTSATHESILLCEAAGYDFIIVETVGVGQSEISVSEFTDFFLLLMLAGAGDELQGIKRGIMEMADAVVITKADGENLEKAKAARAEYAQAMHLLEKPQSDWSPRTMISSAATQMGIREVYEMICEYKQFITANGYFATKRKEQQYQMFLNTLEENLKKKFFADPFIQEKIKQVMEISTREKIKPFALASDLLELFFKGRS